MPSDHRFLRLLRFAVLPLLLAASSLFIGCRSTRNGAGAANVPVIKFTHVPLAGFDNPEKVNAIKGRVIGARPGQRIVLYAYAQAAEAWWVQPLADQPFTTIEPDSTWENNTHPGTQYAALLVGPDFQPPPTAKSLPANGVYATAVVRGGLAFWRTWWFPFVCVFVGAIIILGLHRLRLLQLSRQLNQRFEERLAERTRVAQELHDTLLQGLLSASMQLHVAVSQLPDDAAPKPAFDHVLKMMEQIVDEGRNTLRGLRSASDGAFDLKAAFARIPHELGHPRKLNFHLLEDGAPLPLRPAIRDEVYRIGREAVVNAFRHAGAGNITIELDYGAKNLQILVRDDGCGIDPHTILAGRDGHWGLSGMRERSERIGASLKIRSRVGNGTEVELRISNDIAFESDSRKSASKALRMLYTRSAALAEPASKKRAG